MDKGKENVVRDDSTVQTTPTGWWWKHLVAGGIAGAVSKTITAPLDRIKTFLQVNGKSMGGLRGCLKSMIVEGGVLSLWRGNGFGVLKMVPEAAFKFMAYEEGKQLLKGKSNRELRIEERFLAGAFAGACSQTLIYPLEVINTRLKLRKTGEFKSVVDLTLKMYRKVGFKVFYRGFVPNMLGIIPYSGINFAIYETLRKKYLLRKNVDRSNEPPKAMVLLACGTISSTCGQIATYPLALVRTKLQASSMKVNHSMSAIFKDIIRKEGLGGLFRGIVPNFLKVPAAGITYVVYEYVSDILGVEMT